MIGSRMYIAGALESPYNRHVYRVGQVGYDRQPDLPFDFDEGRCEGFPDKALLCATDNRANVNDDKKCWWYMAGTISVLNRDLNESFFIQTEQPVKHHRLMKVIIKVK